MAVASASPPQSSFKGIVYLSGGLAIFTLQDVIMKLLSGTYPVHEMALVRCLVGLPLLALLVRIEGGWRAFIPALPWHVLWRALLGFVSYTVWYLAIAAMPLADAASIYYANPLIITALAAPLLGEAVGWRRWSAVLVGFAGVLVVMRPGFGAFEPAMLLAFGSAVFYAFSALITRHASGRVMGSTFAFWGTVVFAIGAGVSGFVMGDGAMADESHASLAFLTRAWVWPTGRDVVLLSLCGVIAGISFYCLSQAYLITPASVVTPFEYSSLPWAVLFGFLLWGDLPDAATWIGLALIVGSGLYIVRRERARGRPLVQEIPLVRPRV